MSESDKINELLNNINKDFYNINRKLFSHPAVYVLYHYKTEKIYVGSPENALYKLYRRKNRSDILTMVKTLDLFFISTQVLEKKV